MRDTNEDLAALIIDLDSAIAQAVGNPLLFVDNPLLAALRASCQFLTGVGENVSTGKTSDATQQDERRADLLWQVRSRAGRFQMLLDSSAQFYSSCFSSSPPQESAYGVHGEWNVGTTPSYLAVDC